jgi:hypothetical protein
MSFVAQMKVTGMKASKGDMEGVAYDSTKVYVETGFDESKGTARGFATAEYSFGKSDEYEKYKHLPFPFMAECEIEFVTSGRVQKTIMKSIKPLAAAKG